MPPRIAHPANAIRRCIEFGVTRIEHGSLIDAETARFAAERGAYITPTLVTAVALMETGRELGMSAESLRKCEFVTAGMWEGLEHMRAAGVKLAFGTDLILVDGDPLQDIDLLAQDGQCLSLIVRAGAIIRNRM
jgi:imidazolonepropionase-like amidohydrolase